VNQTILLVVATGFIRLVPSGVDVVEKFPINPPNYVRHLETKIVTETPVSGSTRTSSERFIFCRPSIIGTTWNVMASKGT